MLINSKQEAKIQASERVRPTLSLADELDDAVTQNALGTTAEVLYP